MNGIPSESAGCTGPVRRPGLDWLLLAAVSLGLFLFQSNRLPLVDPDESRCALIVREMVRGGDWVIPHLNGEVYADKPAPFFWLAAGGRWLTGSEELGGRLVSAIAGCLCALVTYAFARRLGGRGAGLLAGLALATAAEYVYIARWYRMDMAFTAAMWAAVWWLARADARRAGPDGRAPIWAGWIGFYAFAGLATVFKGPAGLGLPAVIVAVWMLARGHYRRLLGFLHPAGLAVFLAIAVPWYVAAGLRSPALLQEFLVRQNLQRFTGAADLGHRWPGILYLPILLAGFMPWSVLLPGAIWRRFPRPRGQGTSREQADGGKPGTGLVSRAKGLCAGALADARKEPQVLLLWLAAVLPVLIFAFSGTKMANYILPAFPPLAALVGLRQADWLAPGPADRGVKHEARALAAALVGVALIPMAVNAYFGLFDAWAILPVAGATGGAAVFHRFLRRGRRPQALAACASGAVATWLLVAAAAGPAYDHLSTRSLAGLAPPVPAGAKAFALSSPLYSFQLYTGCAEVRPFRSGEAGELRPWLVENGPALGLVKGESRLRLLNQAQGVSCEQLAQRGELILVRARAEITARGSESRASNSE